MAENRTSKQSLFRLSGKRKSDLSNIESLITNRISSYEGMKKAYEDNKFDLEEEVVKGQLIELEENIKSWSIDLQVIQTILFHSDKEMLTFVNPNNPWRTEWDIPADIYVKSLMRMQKWLENMQRSVSPDLKPYYTLKILLMKQLILHRHTDY